MGVLQHQFIELVNKELADREWSRSDLARAMGRSPQYVGNYLNSHSNAGTPVMESMFHAMGLQLDLTVSPSSQKD